MSREETQDENPAGAKARPWLSRLFVGAIFLWIIGFGLGALILSMNPPKGGREVASPFKPWEGEWEGELAAFNAMTGAAVSRTTYRQTFRHVAAGKDFRQEGHFEAADAATGKAEEEKLLNQCQFDGTGLRRKTLKHHGGVVIEYRGSVGPAGILWWRAIPGAIETLSERVEGDRYFVEGYGIYGGPDQFVVFMGEFRRAGARPTTAP